MFGQGVDHGGDGAGGGVVRGHHQKDQVVHNFFVAVSPVLLVAGVAQLGKQVCALAGALGCDADTDKVGQTPPRLNATAVGAANHRRTHHRHRRRHQVGKVVADGFNFLFQFGPQK